MKTVFLAALALFALGCGGTTIGTTTTTGGATGGASGGSTGTPAFDATKTYGELIAALDFPATFNRLDQPNQSFSGSGGFAATGVGYVNLASTARAYDLMVDVPSGVPSSESTFTVRGTGLFYDAPQSSIGMDIYGEMTIRRGTTRFYISSYVLTGRMVNDHSKIITIPLSDTPAP